MKILKGNFGECRFCDCIGGMKELADNSFELCMTDPPYNFDYKGKYKISTIVSFNDSIAKYPEFCQSWLAAARRVAKFVTFTPGIHNQGIYYKIADPSEYIIHYKPLTQGSTYLASNTNFEPILCYGKYPKWDFAYKPFPFNVIRFPTRIEKSVKIHTSPKSYELWHYIISRLNLSPVLDPFLGSGTTAEVCESLGLNWLGFEIMEAFAPDIEHRINAGIERYNRKAIKLEVY